MRYIIIGLTCALALGVAGCSKDRSPAPQASADATVTPPAASQPAPRATRKPVQIEMKNVRLWADEGIVLDVRALRGEMVSKVAGEPPVFDNQQSLQGLADQLTTPVRDVTVVRDDEHNTWTLNIDDRTTGYSRVDTIGPEFVMSGEFRTLAASYAEIAAIVRSMRKGPVEVQMNGAAPVEEEPINEETGEALTADEKDALNAIGVAPTTSPAAPVHSRRPSPA